MQVPSSDSGKIESFESKLHSYANLLSHPDPTSSQDLKTLAETTVELDTLAQAVAHAASPTIKGAADDLEKLLKSPLSVSDTKEVSILVAAQHYLKNPETAELKPLVEALRHNDLACQLMCKEITLLSDSVKKI